ncbi:hypothetical protein [Sandaracinus amylolyticus]|uniref:hypothetical protein n=1 Tax=Sandaracinus amylolyticus TaxID=927083 RepID=UPI001F16F96C|nr:hypothetical protein [Sandaracinus amylolyticus]UJR82076.1 Proline/alanine-rich repetetive membrane anchored protein [Sandaracinus amylolyticus]
MTKKTASKSSPKPAARAPRASSGQSAARQSAKSAPSKAPAKPSAATKSAAPKSNASAKKPSARAATPTPPPPKAVSERPAPIVEDVASTSGITSAGGIAAGGGGGGGAGELADRILEASDAASVAAHAEHLTSDKPTTATAAARILDELLAKKPEMLVPTIDKLVSVITSGPKRSVQTAAAALPVMARLAPARVARHLPTLTDRFAEASEIGKDGLVSTFAALCTASVAYQKRLEPVLELALSTADPKTLQRWTEIVLPSLKGEPHARARAVVEDRLNHIPRPQAQPIATFLGIKLRPAAMR